MLQKDLIQKLDNLRDCVECVHSDVAAYSENDETIRKVCSMLDEISFVLNALAYRIELESARKENVDF